MMNAGKCARRLAAAARKKTNEQRRQANGPRVNRHLTRHEAETLRIAQFEYEVEYKVDARFEHWIRKHIECASLEHRIGAFECASLVCSLLAGGRRDRTREKRKNEKPADETHPLPTTCM